MRERTACPGASSHRMYWPDDMWALAAAVDGNGVYVGLSEGTRSLGVNTSWLVVKPEVAVAEVLRRRADPDAVPSYDGAQICGRNLVTVLARNPAGNERVILDLDFKPVAGVSDATVATDMALALFHQRPAAAGVVYDMALHAADVDRILGRGRLPISKVQRTSGNRVARISCWISNTCNPTDVGTSCIDRATGTAIITSRSASYQIN